MNAKRLFDCNARSIGKNFDEVLRRRFAPLCNRISVADTLPDINDQCNGDNPD